jgi:hypothetical protein
MKHFKLGFVKSMKILQVILQVFATVSVNLVTVATEVADIINRGQN